MILITKSYYSVFSTAPYAMKSFFYNDSIVYNLLIWDKVLIGLFINFN